MKFNPITKEVYTDKGEFIKKLSCPFRMNWNDLEKGHNSVSRKCSNCDHSIVDTEVLSDNELLKMVKQDPETCLKIDLNQNNIKIISNGIWEQR